MQKQYKHIPSKLLYTSNGLGMYTTPNLLGSVHPSIVENGKDWEEIKNNNPLNLEVGKTYVLQYSPNTGTSVCPAKSIIITHFTEAGYPWGKGDMINGIITGSWKIVDKLSNCGDTDGDGNCAKCQNKPEICPKKSIYPIGAKVQHKNTLKIYIKIHVDNDPYNWIISTGQHKIMIRDEWIGIDKNYGNNL